MACLDTTILVDMMRHRSKLRARAFDKLEELLGRGELLVTTRLSVAELYVGVERSDRPDQEEELIREAVGGLGILDFDQRAARLFARITAYLQEIGRPAGDMDVLIGATSMAAGHCLITHNASHFENIPDLAVETY